MSNGSKTMGLFFNRCSCGPGYTHRGVFETEFQHKFGAGFRCKFRWKSGAGFGKPDERRGLRGGEAVLAAYPGRGRKRAGKGRYHDSLRKSADGNE